MKKIIKETDNLHQISRQSRGHPDMDYQAIFDAVNDTIFILDKETGAILDANRKVEEMYGYTIDEVIHRTLGDIGAGASPYSRDDMDRWVNRAKKKGPQLFEWLAQNKSKHLFWVEVNLKRAHVKGEDFIIAVVRDIAERKRVEKELTITKNYLKTVFNKIHDAVFVHDLSGKIVDVNDTMLLIYRCTREDAVGLYIVPDFTAPDNTDADHQPVLWQKVMAGEDQFFEWKARRPSDGTTLDVEVALTKLSLPEGDFILASIHDITERKLVEKELTVTRNYLNTVFHNIHDAVFIHDIEGKVIDVNDKMLDIYQFTSRDEAIGLSIVPDYTAPGDPVDHRANWQKVMAGEDQFFECTGRRPKDGYEFMVDAFLTKLSLPEGDFILGSVRDITQRKIVEQELHATKEYLATVFNNIHDAVFINDLNGKVIDVNDKMLDMYHFATREEALRYSIIDDYTTPDGRPDFPTMWKRVLAGEDETFECKGRRPKDGYEFDVEGFLTRLPLLDGDSVLAIIRDITDRKQVERELVATKDYLKTIFDSIHDAVFVHDVDGKVIDVNDKMLEMYHLTREEAIGLSIIRDYTTSEGRPDFSSIWKDVIQGKDTFFECKGQRPKDGFTFDVEVFLTRLPLPAGDYILATIRNITDRKVIEKQLNKERETFFSVLEDNPHGIALIDHSNQYVYVNPEFTEITGYELADIPTWWDWIQEIEGDAQPISRAFDLQGWRTLGDGKDGKIESKIRCKNGDYKYVEFRITNLQDKRLLVLTDVTARKSAEEGLYMEKKKFQILSDSSPLGMVVVDGNNKSKLFKFKYMNPKFKELFGCSMKNVSTIHEWLEWVYPDPVSRRGMASKWVDILEDIKPGINRSYIRKLGDQDGSKKHIQFIPVQLQDSEILIACWDITRNRDAEHKIRERKLVLEVLNDIMASVTGSLRLSEILQALKKVFIEKLKINAGGIFFYSEVDNKIKTEVYWGVPETLQDDLGCFAMKCNNDGKIVYENDITIVKYQQDGSNHETTVGFEKYRWRSYICISLPIEGEAQCLIFLAGRKRDTFSNDRMAFYKTLGQQISVALQNARLFEQVEQSHSEMKALSLRLVRVQEDELQHVARELHDEIGQLLTGLGLTLEVASQTPGGETASLREAKSLANTITGLVRELSLKLRPSMLDDLGLLPTLPWLFRRFSGHSNVQVAFEHMHVDNRRFSHEVETAVYRITQEALTNVARHANVNWATVRLWSTDKILAVQIEDHGDGFDSYSTLKEEDTNGLSGIRERILLLGGRFTLETQPGAGTRLTAELPIDMEGKLI
jgi:PAS domain S-box-containing protein